MLDKKRINEILDFIENASSSKAGKTFSLSSNQWLYTNHKITEIIDENRNCSIFAQAEIDMEGETYLKELGMFIKTLKGVKALDVLPYHNMAIPKYEKLGMDYKLKDTQPLSKEDGIKARDIILNAIKN